MIHVFKRIILVDDHQMFTEALKMMLSTFRVDSEIFCSSSTTEARKIIEERKIELAIVDINMPEKNGIDFISEIKNDGLKLKTIILTSEEDPAILEKALNAGIDGILLKGVGGVELLQALVDIAEGKKFYGSGIAARLIKSHSDDNVENIICLSTRELEILRMFCGEYSSNEISEKLDISVHTVDSHRKNIMRKINVKGMIGLYKWAVEHNLLED